MRLDFRAPAVQLLISIQNSGGDSRSHYCNVKNLQLLEVAGLLELQASSPPLDSRTFLKTSQSLNLEWQQVQASYLSSTI